MSEDPTAAPPAPRFQLLDVAALVVGYALAALLFRAFWPGGGVRPAHGLFAAGLYAWLGLAMSGPLLLLRRRGRAPSEPPATPPRSATTPPRAAAETTRSWAELAWLLIGVYWIVMGVFILPIRLQSFRFGDTVLFGLAPLLAAVAFRLFGPRTAPGAGSEGRWTHRVAVWLLATWPVAWLCLIVLGEAYL